MNLKDSIFEGVDYILLPQDKVQWWAFVNRVMSVLGVTVYGECYKKLS
jgi:hypothetical protein